ncbi:MAG: cupin domain-containing protein [Amaricoccus sp.]
MRVRRLIVEPGGIVPWHNHADRSALIVTVKGEIMEYASTCAAPIVRSAGEVARELPATSHWWKNLSTEPVELLSFDILHGSADTNM